MAERTGHYRDKQCKILSKSIWLKEKQVSFGTSVNKEPWVHLLPCKSTHPIRNFVERCLRMFSCPTWPFTLLLIHLTSTLITCPFPLSFTLNFISYHPEYNTFVLYLILNKRTNCVLFIVSSHVVLFLKILNSYFSLFTLPNSFKESFYLLWYYVS